MPCSEGLHTSRNMRMLSRVHLLPGCTCNAANGQVVVTYCSSVVLTGLLHASHQHTEMARTPNIQVATPTMLFVVVVSMLLDGHVGEVHKLIVQLSLRRAVISKQQVVTQCWKCGKLSLPLWAASTASQHVGQA